MLSLLMSFVEWNVSPTIFTLQIGDIPLPITWYGLFFASGFFIGQYVLTYIFQHDHRSALDVQSLTIYIIVATIIGARLGHFLFYEWQLLIIDSWQWVLTLLIPPFRGLASHGATISIPLAIYLYSRTKSDQSFLWITDRLIIPVSLAGAFIRTGNLFNSEIYGTPTNLPWGFLFIKETDPSLLPVVPRHPTQIYEALFCLLLLIVTFLIWKFKRHITSQGFSTGLFLILLFGFRFFIEFLKNNQSEFENSLSLNMGQLLSIPPILAGTLILFLIRHDTVVNHSSL